MSTSPDYKISFEAFSNVINNELTETAKTRHAISSTGRPLWECPVSGDEEVERAVSASNTAFRSWSKLSQDQRAVYLDKFAHAIDANIHDLTKLVEEEVGMPVCTAVFELPRVREIIEGVPRLRLKEASLTDDEDEEHAVILRYVPLGVCVVIVPWNFPLMLGLGKLMPALLAGNTFIWKPSPHSPYSALKLAELGTKVFPPGVFQALSGEDTLGPLLTAHPDVAKVSFTGSAEVGKQVLAACAGTLKRVTLHLGGNDAAIICDDVDIKSIASDIAMLAFAYSGQMCTGIKRIYVHESIFYSFLAALVKETKEFEYPGHKDPGDHNDDYMLLGSIRTPEQYEKLEKLYSQISKEGWKTNYGGEPYADEKPRLKMRPTILDNPPDDSSVVVDEKFGPIVPVLKWTDEDDVIKRVNASRLGLGASVWTKDIPRAQRLARQLEAGSVWINSHFETDHRVPFGGRKESGIGTELGELGLQGWCNPQAIWINRSDRVPYLSPHGRQR